MDHAGVLGGAELYLLDLVKRYSETHEVTNKVLLFSDGPFRERLVAAGVDAEVMQASAAVTGVSREDRGGGGLRAIPGLLGLVRRVAKTAKDYDVIFANSQKAFVVGALAGRLARRPVVWCLHDILTAEHFSRTNRRLVVTLANYLCAQVIANSQATADAFRAAGGRAPVRVVHNGIDAAPFAASVTEDASDASLREELGLGDAPVVSIFSRLSPWKGQHVLLEALPHLPGVHALLVGEALFGEAAYAQKLRERASALGLTERVRFLGFRSDIPALMKLSDVVLHTSVAPEPFGRVIVEGMMAGRPVVAANAGGAVEIVGDDGGILVEPDDAQALHRALESLLTQPDVAAALAAGGRERAMTHFSLQGMVDSVAACLAEVANRGGRDGGQREHGSEPQTSPLKTSPSRSAERR